MVAKTKNMQETIGMTFMFVSTKRKQTLLVSSWRMVNVTRRKVPLERPERSAKPELYRDRQKNLLILREDPTGSNMLKLCSLARS